MRFSEIQVGHQYAAGRNYQGAENRRDRVLVLEVGEFKAQVVESGRGFWTHTTTKKGAYVRYLDAETGEILTKRLDRVRNVLVEDAKDTEYSELYVEPEGPRRAVEAWVPSAELHGLWSDYVLAQREVKAAKARLEAAKRNNVEKLTAALKAMGIEKHLYSADGSIRLDLWSGDVQKIADYVAKVEGL